MMKPLVLAAAACAILLIAPTAKAKLVEMKTPTSLDDIHTSPTAAIKLFVQAINAEDWDKAASVVAPSAIIVDNIPPFQWHSFAEWRNGVTQYRAVLHITDYHMALTSFLALSGTADANYSVQPATLSFGENGVPRTSRGFFTFTTAKIEGRWYVTGWTWTDVERSDFWENVAPEHPLY